MGKRPLRVPESPVFIAAASTSHHDLTSQIRGRSAVREMLGRGVGDSIVRLSGAAPPRGHDGAPTPPPAFLAPAPVPSSTLCHQPFRIMPRSSLRRVACWSGSLGLLLLLLAPAALAQSETLTPYDIARIQTVGDVAVSPDGDHVAYLVSVPRDPFEENATPHTELHLYAVEDDATRELYGGEVSVSGLSWTPDGERIAFLTRVEDEDEATALYTMDPQTEAMERVLSFGSSVGAYSWSPDGERVAFIAAEPTEETDSVLPYEPEIYEENLTDRRLWVADVDGDEPEMMDVPGTVYQVEWSPAGDRIAVAVAPTALIDDFYVNQRIRVLDAETGAVVTRIENPGKLGPMGWSPNGNYLAYIAAADVNDPSAGRLMVADAATGATVDVLPQYADRAQITSFVWEDDDVLRYTADVGVETVLERVRREGGDAPETLVPAGTAIFGDFSASLDGATLAFAASSPQHPSELFVWTEGGEGPRRVTDTNPWLAEKRMAPQEVVEYEARDGLVLQGLLIRPLDAAAPAPTIVIVHGGPEAHYSNGWLTAYSLLGQLGAARGFAVFYPNYRGSTGRGVAFSKISQGDPAGAEFDDIVDGVDHLIAEGVADADRVGVTGGSYGGYATGWLSTRYTDRFAAGVMFVGIANKISKFGTSDIPNELYLVHDLEWPWEDYQKALERSPIYYAGQSETPLLIMHGAEDPRVHPAQSLELYRHLKLRGEAPVRLVLYPGEGHGNRNATARYDYTLRALRWFEHFLMEAAEELPPSDLDALAEQERPMMEPVMDGAGSN